MLINFLNEYYKASSVDQNATDLVNMYLEIENQNVQSSMTKGGLQLQHGKYKVIALPSPGKTTFNTGSGSVTRGSISHRGVYYAVVDNKFYSYASDGTRTERGTLSTSTGIVQLAAISNQIEMIDGTSIYNYNTGTTTFATVSDGDAPTSPNAIAAQDETFFVSSANATAVQGSDVSDGTSWNALSFNSKSYSGDYVARLLSVNSRLWVIGEFTTEIWYNSGAATFSFEIVQGSGIEYGTPAKNSVAYMNGVIYMLAQSRSGGRCILSMAEGQVSPNLNQGINKQINALTTVSDAIGYTYEYKGHTFYILTFPTEGVTFEYDITNDLWSSRMSNVSSSYTRDLGNCYAYCYGKHLVGAYNSGTIYYLDSASYTENGTAILRRIVTPPAYAEGKKLYFDKLQIDTETDVGSNLTVTLDVSKDSGHTFADTYSGTLPSAGGRMFWTRLGMTQNAFVLKVSTTVNANFTVLGAWGEFRKGGH